jgi:hypothetical protein
MTPVQPPAQEVAADSETGELPNSSSRPKPAYMIVIDTM